MHDSSVAARCAFVALILSVFAPTLSVAETSENGSENRWIWEKEIFVPMSDGVNLSTDIIRPRNARGALPAVLVRTPYNKEHKDWPAFRHWYETFLQGGYAVILQNERGRYLSEGEFDNLLAGAKNDGRDMAEWVANQPWSNGKVGTIGCSASAESQLPMSAANHPAHAAMIAMAPGPAVGDIPGNHTQGAFYRGGVPMIGVWSWWYRDEAPSERVLPPPNSTQEQRVRLRNGFSLDPVIYFRRPGEDHATIEARLASALRHLPSRDILRALGGPLTPFDKYITWSPSDSRWRDVPLITGADKPRVPSLYINTWHDVGITETIRMFSYLRNLGVPNQHLIIGAGPHCAHLSELTQRNGLDFADLKFGDLHVGDVRYQGLDDGYRQLFVKWFDHWLKGAENGVTEMPAVQLFVMGKGWMSGDRWPLESTQFKKYYLRSDGSAGANPAGGRLSRERPIATVHDDYVYDLNDPVPSVGGGCCSPQVARDQRAIEKRRDVLTYTTTPSDKGTTVVGPVEVVLFVSSSAKDTDFFVKVEHVHPDGKAVNLGDDAFRVRYRDGFDKNAFMKPGEVYRIKLDNIMIADHFPIGHRLRLQISSSNFPLFERNLNTGGDNSSETEAIVATNAVHHGGQYASHIILPVIPD